MLRTSDPAKLLPKNVLGRFAKAVQDMSLPWLGGKILTSSEMTTLYTSNKEIVSFPFPSIGKIKRLYDGAMPASFGKGRETVLDTNYRSARTLTTKDFSLNLKPEPPLLNQIKHFMLKNYDPDEYIRAELYRVNIYGPGDFFNEHRDTPQTASGHFGSLVFCLPTKFEGGALVLRNSTNAEEEVKFDWGASFSRIKRKRKQKSDDLTESAEKECVVEFAAFASDLVHLIEPVTAGYRVTVTYHLFLEKVVKEDFLKPVFAQFETRNIQREMVELVKSKKLSGKKVLFPLAHQYSARKGSDVVLKGVDAALFQILKDIDLEPKIMFYYDQDPDVRYNPNCRYEDDDENGNDDDEENDDNGEEEEDDDDDDGNDDDDDKENGKDDDKVNDNDDDKENDNDDDKVNDNDDDKVNDNDDDKVNDNDDEDDENGNDDDDEEEDDDDDRDDVKEKDVFLTSEVIETSDDLLDGYDEYNEVNALAKVHRNVIWARKPVLDHVCLSEGSAYGNDAVTMSGYYGNVCILTKW